MPIISDGHRRVIRDGLALIIHLIALLKAKAPQNYLHNRTIKIILGCRTDEAELFFIFISVSKAPNTLTRVPLNTQQSVKIY